MEHEQNSTSQTETAQDQYADMLAKVTELENQLLRIQENGMNGAKNANDSNVKELARKSFKQGWKTSTGREEYTSIQEKTMENRFEKWWKLNHEDEY